MSMPEQLIIFGVPRSGTTILFECLEQGYNQHDRYNEKGIPFPNPPLRFIQKMPQDCLLVDEYRKRLPNAWFVFLVRDPFSVLTSVERYHERYGKSQLALPNGFDTTRLEEHAELWAHYVQQIPLIRGQLDRVVRFEDFVNAPFDTLHTTIGLNGMPADVLAYTADHVTASHEHARDYTYPGGAVSMTLRDQVRRVSAPSQAVQQAVNWGIGVSLRRSCGYA